MSLTVDTTRAAERARLRSDIAIAARVLAPYWPIDTFIAVNPLSGLEDRPFGEAIEIGGRLFGARGTLTEPAFRREHAAGRITDADLLAALRRRVPRLLAASAPVLGGRPAQPGELLLADLLHGEPAPAPRRLARTRSEREAPRVADRVDAQTTKWCAAFLDDAGAWPMPGREAGFYPAWRALAARDRSLPGAVRERLRELAERADDALLDALEALGVAVEAQRGTLQAHLTRLPGWAAHVRWSGEHGGGIDLVGYLALRLTYETLLLEHAPAQEPALDPARRTATPGERAERAAAALGAGEATGSELARVAALLAELPVAERALIWQDSYEGHYRDELLTRLAGNEPAAATTRPAAQLVCCIDVRSEGLRRHMEATGPYETLGFAGFFAVAIRFQDLSGGAPSALCPVLLEARNVVAERPASGAEALAERRLAGARALAGAHDGFHAAKDDLVAPFALAEASGWVAGPLAAGRTLLAGRFGALRGRLARRAVPPAPTSLAVHESFSLEERLLFARAALTMMGLTGGFGRLVVLCGHGSTTENNPYAASLDCGACGGNRGAPNARVAAAILNGTDVRDGLARDGIVIPDDTWFVAAEHDTATDQVELLDAQLVPPGHHAELAQLAADLQHAGEALSAERCASLPGAPAQPTARAAARHARARSTDWAQVYPEWGLAGNAAFIVGPRTLTRGLDLGRRTFLHSYEAGVDADGTALETILTAPLVVAQWISCQYLFSSVDPEVFGAGTKTIHNVVASVGVIAGHDGDLQLGLPWQSVSDGERLVHEPLRLLAVVQAPLARIDAIVARNTVLQHLFDNEWVALAARENHGDPWRRRTPDDWRPWLEATR